MDIEKMISEMTLEEKASLLSGEGFWHTKAVERLGIPKIMVCDGPHGLRKQDETGDHPGVNDSIRAVCFPAACATAASFDRKLLRTIGEEMGTSCQKENVAVILGPAVNIKRSPLCGRNFEYFSEDPYLAGELAGAFIEGVQSRHVGTSIKHFAANSQEHRRMSSDSVVDERTLREIYFPAFETAVKKAKPWTVMCSYNRLNGELASSNSWLLTQILREEWGFDGLVMSDWGAVSDRIKAVKAGLDLEMPGSGGANDKRIVMAVKEGKLEEQQVDLCVRRVLELVDRFQKDRDPDAKWDMEAQHAMARKLAAQCMVLLKNEEGILPFRKEKTTAVIGKFAQRPRYQGGGSSHINSFRVESLMDALAEDETILNSGILYAKGYDLIREEPDEVLIEEAVKAAGEADQAVIVAGLPDLFESEGYDRSHMRLPACQNELIRRVAAANPNTVVVLYNGSPVEMPWISEVKGVIEAYLGGQAVGGATKDVLFGDAGPEGRLPESFPLQLEDNPSFLTYGGEGNSAVYSEGIFVGYRYYDRKKMQVLYPFGYGLSYTDFSYSNLQIEDYGAAYRSDLCQEKDPDAPFLAGENARLIVSADITNTGKTAGAEVVQLYIGAPEGEMFRPVRELKGFEKVWLAPGETKTVSFVLEKRSFAYWSTKLSDWFVPSGVYTVFLAHDSRDLRLQKEIIVNGITEEPLEEITPDTILLDLKKNPKAMGILEPAMQQMMKIFGGGGSEDAKESAKEAITEEMNNAMLNYMPLHALVNFGSGAVTYEQVQKLARRINRENQ